LIQFKNPGNLTGLEFIAINDPSPVFRTKAVYAIGLMKNARSVPVINRALKDTDFRVRSEACNSLKTANNKESVEMLIELVKTDPELYVRYSALYALESIKQKSSVIPLYDILAIEKNSVLKILINEVLRNIIAGNL